MVNTMAATFGLQAANRALLYTTANEFCSIFNQEMDSLFSLALILTGSEEKAEQCFSAALEKCQKSTTVFRDWARSYSRVAIIEKAIEVIQPASGRGDRGKFANDLSVRPLPEVELVLRVAPFDRFVYVLTVLDRFTVQDCAILMRCHTREVERAQASAFQFIAANGDVSLPQLKAAANRLAS